MKKCSNPKCKNPIKPESQFHRDKSRSDGLRDRCKECINEYGQKRNTKRKQIRRNQYLELEYGFLPGEFEKISKSQDHKCLICGLKKKLDVDHSYKTYLNRGLLCRTCNTKLGWYENNSNSRISK